MKRLVVAGVLAVTVSTPLAAKAVDLASASPAPERPNQLALAVSVGSGGSPLGHAGLELRFAHRRLEAAVGAGLFIAQLCVGESHPTIDACFHPVAALAVRYNVLRVGRFELAPGLGLSFQPAHHTDQITRAAYGLTTWDWHWGMFAPRLNVDFEARYRAGSWFYGVVVGAGAMIGEADQCTAQNMNNLWTCSNVPSPAYAAPTPFAVTAYGQVVLGRGF